MGLGDDSITYPLAQADRHHAFQQGVRVGCAQSGDFELRQPSQFAGWLADAEQEGDGFCEQPTGHERKNLRGGSIKPLGVVHDAQERLRHRHVGQQAQHRQGDQETIRWCSSLQPEHGFEGVALRRRKAVESIEQRRAQLVQRSEGQFHLGLDAAGE